jgi:hypothetical protein
MTYLDVFDIIGYVLRFLGALVFGLGMGWLTIRQLKQEMRRDAGRVRLGRWRRVADLGDVQAKAEG